MCVVRVCLCVCVLCVRACVCVCVRARVRVRVCVQMVPHGYRVMHGGRLITVFSARNYLERETNDRCVVYI